MAHVNQTAPEEFGEKRLCGIVQENCTQPFAEILEEILKQERAYIREQEPRDDMTLVVARTSESPTMKANLASPCPMQKN